MGTPDDIKAPNNEQPTLFPEQLITTEELAHELRVSPQHIEQWAAHNEIPRLRLPGGILRFKKKEILQWVASLECQQIKDPMRKKKTRRRIDHVSETPLVAKRFRMIRVLNAMSQKNTAFSIGMNKESVLANYEHSDVMFNRSVIHNASRYFGISEDWLMHGTPPIGSAGVACFTIGKHTIQPQHISRVCTDIKEALPAIVDDDSDIYEMLDDPLLHNDLAPQPYYPACPVNIYIIKAGKDNFAMIRASVQPVINAIKKTLTAISQIKTTEDIRKYKARDSGETLPDAIRKGQTPHIDQFNQYIRDITEPF